MSTGDTGVHGEHSIPNAAAVSAGDEQRNITGSATNERVLIIGASSGIGAATARRFASQGAAVSVAARRSDLIGDLAEEIAGFPLELDVTSRDQSARVVSQAARQMGGLTVLVNCAGVCIPTPLYKLDEQAWSQHINVNLSGTFYVAQAAAMLMASSSGGAITNVASELATIGMSGFTAYCAAKAGVLGLTRAMAAELAPKVRVNAVCPGPIDTPMLRSEFALFPDPEAVERETVTRIPLLRLGNAEEVAEAIVFLSTATFATGTCLQLDGGTTSV